VLFLQRALNAFNRQAKDYPDISVDGLFGASTAAALCRFLQLRGSLGEKVMLAAMNAQQGMRYFEIAEKRPTSEDFEFGWWANRVVT
jgi:lysozyme family protein